MSGESSDQQTDFNTLLTPQTVLDEPRYQPDDTMRALMMGSVEGRPFKHPSAWHLDGVSWFAKGAPRWLHRHRAQTVGLIDFDEIHCCACGALRYGPSGSWLKPRGRR